MLWYTDVIKKVMVVKEVFIKDVRTEDVTVSVIRLRGGIDYLSLFRAKRTRSGALYDRAPDPGGYTIIDVASAALRAVRKRIVVRSQASTNIPLCPADTFKQFRVQSLMYTAYSYTMSPVLHNVIAYCDTCRVGYGPGLYWTTDERLAIAGLVNPLYGTLNQYTIPDKLTATAYSANSRFGIIYVFAADWFGAEMQTDPQFQIATGDPQARLGWAAAQIETTTDPNTPVTFENISTNKDWSRIRHFATQITFDMVNLAPFPYVVEIMFFKFDVDPQDLTYFDMQNAPYCNQYYQVQAYCEGSIQTFGTPQIKVLKRKRIMIHGLDQRLVLSNDTENATYACATANTTHGNTAKYSFKIKRQYDCVRGIKKEFQSLTETTFFNYFYEANEGVYCRVQAWPMNPLWTTTADTATVRPNFIVCNNAYDLACIPSDTAKSLAVTKPCLYVRLEKRSFIKVDSPMLKGPFTA